MNNDLISRERLKNTILLGNYDTQSKILSAIDNAPTVEPEITEKQAILFLINNGWLVNHDKELRERWERPQGKWGKWIRSRLMGGAETMTPKEAAEIINTIRRYHAHCGGCYVKGDQEALEIAENVLRGLAALEEATTK